MTHFICNTSLVFGGCRLTSNSLCLSQTCFDVSLNNFSNFNVFHVQNLWLDHTNQTWLCRPETNTNEREEAVANAGDGNACGLGPDQLELAAARHLAAADRQFTNQ